ncbi:MAG: type I glutamate--ammonia ligase [Legionellaceae bacterium]|nr:type I glutamate--ammonia ligase [Legionellaceae bacterium]
MNKNDFDNLIKKHDAKFVDLRFTDVRGKEHHITVSPKCLDESFIHDGKMIDGSSFKGWQEINHADLALTPDLSTATLDPFYQDNTIIVRCDVHNPTIKTHYDKDPRTLASRAEEYLRSTGIADDALFGPEPEFFIFDDVRWDNHISNTFYEINSEEGYWNSGAKIDGGNTGHRPAKKGGYFPAPPIDSSQDIRSAICEILEEMGIIVEAHHHEVATANQCEVVTRFNTLAKKADEMQMIKYVVRNVAHGYGKTATFMPKPLVGDNGSGMHCHQSLVKDNVNLFHGDKYAKLSQTALYYIGGIIKHARALNALTNPTINSYKRLIPGYEAPILLAYSECNRSASIRIPYTSQDRSRRIEVRFPDPLANPYFAFAGLMMAGLDGIKNKIDPGPGTDKNLYNIPKKDFDKIPKIASTLDEATDNLEKDHEFLMAGDVFSKQLIETCIDLRREEIEKMKTLVHPYEFEMYYSD